MTDPSKLADVQYLVSDNGAVELLEKHRGRIDNGQPHLLCLNDLKRLIGDVISVSLRQSAQGWQDSRNERQRTVSEWCAAAFGNDHAYSIQQRGIRMLEEAIEAYQACGCQADMAHRLVNYIFAKEPGNLKQELGGVGVTVLALAAAAVVSADEAERDEVARILAKPLEHFHARNEVKNAAGFNVVAPPADGEQNE